MTDAAQSTEPTAPSVQPVRTRRRQVLEGLWIVGSVAYGALRIFIADRTVKKYGVNIWGFAAVELVTSFGYGLGTARVVGAFIDHDRGAALRWGVLAVATFLAPEAYIVITGRGMPTIVYVVLAVLLVVLGTIGTISIRRRVHHRHRHPPIIH